MKRTKQNRLSIHRKKKVAKSAQNHEEKQAVNSESDTQQSVQLPRKKVRWEGNSESVAAVADTENVSSEDDASISKICLTICCQSGRVAGAYYDSVRCIVYVLEDTQEDVHFDLTNMLLEQCNANVVLTSSKADDPFISVLQKFAEASGGVFQIRPHKEFTPHRGRDRLLSLRFLSELTTEDTGQCLSSDGSSGAEPRNAYEFMQKRKQAAGDPTMKRWNAAIRLANHASVESSPLCISCVGALLDYLARERAAGDLDDDDAGVEGLNISGIEVLTLDQVMHINADALFSLQIFENESHASIHSDKTKEGLSLFGIIDNTRTPLGRSLLRIWLMRPSLSIPVIAARHDAIECFLHPENLAPASTLQNHLKGIKNIPRILGLLKAGKAGVGDWQGLVKFTYHSAMMCDALVELHGGDQVEVVRKLVASLDIAGFKNTGNAVNETIDWEESTNNNRICVRPYIDEELDQRKHVYAGLDTVLCKVAEQICRKIPVDYTASLNVVYFPQLGFLICVPMQEEWRSEEGIKVLDGWSFQFSSDAHVYFKSEEMHGKLTLNLIPRKRAIQAKDMDTHIGDLHPSIVDREIEIVQELLERILVFSEGMRYVCDVCAELDCLLAFAEASRAYNYCRPQMSEGPIIDIDQGRHPLQEQVVDIFVPNNAQLSAGIGFGDRAELQETDSLSMCNSIVLCTGANACGKSVYLKQVALIQYMAQIGCFVPAVSATLGIVDKIFTRIQTRESVSKAQSAFMIDLNQVSLALRNCTVNSLILLDEFGKGTIPADGAGLFCGVIKHLLNRGSQCPKVLAATHFHEVFQKDMLDPHKLPITFLHMQVLFTSSKGNLNPGDVSISGDSESINHDRVEPTSVVAPGEKITYLYRVSPGLSRNSHAAQCAMMFGLPSRIAQRALYVSTSSKLLGDHELRQLLEEKMTVEEQDNIKAAGIAAYKFLAMDLTNDSHEKDIKLRLIEALGRVPHE